MSPKKELVLQAERFREDADLEFRIPSKKEILFILQQIAEQGTRVVLYFDDHQNFILTTLLGANSNGMWLDVGPFAPDNKRLLLSNKITFVSMHQHVKVQFTADAIQSVQLEGQDTFFMPLPPYLLRIQRRNNFRLNIPFGSPVKCVITIRPEDPQRSGAVEKTREISVLDISGGGIGLLCDESDPDLEKGNVFDDCRIFLPDLEEIKVRLVVRGTFKFTMQNDAVKVCAGCQFTNLDTQASNLLQRYIARLQAEERANQ